MNLRSWRCVVAALVVTTGVLVAVPIGTSPVQAAGGAGHTKAVVEGEPTHWVLTGGVGMEEGGGWHREFTDIRLVDTHPDDVSFYVGDFRVGFSSPFGEELRVGAYENVRRWPSSDPAKPGLGMFGEGRGCNTVTGRFVIDELVRDASGTVTNFAARFEHHCEDHQQIGVRPALWGSIAYHASESPIDRRMTPKLFQTGAAVGSPSPPRWVTITNNGPRPLHPTAAYLDGPDAAAFFIGRDSCTGAIVLAGESCGVEVLMHPPAGPASSTPLRAYLHYFDELSPGGTGHQVQVFGHVSTPDPNTPPPPFPTPPFPVPSSPPPADEPRPSGPIGGYQAVDPVRVLDTRAVAIRLAADEIRTVDLSARLPAAKDGSWTAASVNLTADQPSAAGYLTAWPCDAPRPATSVVNYQPGRATASHAIVLLAAGEASFCVYSSAATDVIVDVFGGFSALAPGTARLRPVEPRRIYDSRTAPGLISSGSSTRVDLPADVALDDRPVAALVNLTVTDPTADGYVSAASCSTGFSEVSNLNFMASEWAHANAAIVPVDDGGGMCLYNHGATDMIVDVIGVFSSSADGLVYQPATPRRLLDTRTGVAGAQGPVQSGQRIDVAVPGGRAFAVGTLTAVDPTGAGYLTLWDGTGAPPEISNLGFATGTNTANFAASGVSGGGTISVYNGQVGGHHVLFDLTGWFMTLP